MPLRSHYGRVLLAKKRSSLQLGSYKHQSPSRDLHQPSRLCATFFGVLFVNAFHISYSIPQNFHIVNRFFHLTCIFVKKTRCLSQNKHRVKIISVFSVAILNTIPQQQDAPSWHNRSNQTYSSRFLLWYQFPPRLRFHTNGSRRTRCGMSSGCDRS